MTPIFNANTVTGIVAESIITNAVLPPIVRCAPLPSIGTRGRLKRVQTGKQRMAHVISNTAAQSNPTNHQSGDTVVEEIELNVVHISKAAGLTAQEQNIGLNPALLNDGLARLAEQDIWDNHVSPLIAAAGFGAADVSVLPASFDETHLEDLIAACVSMPRALMIQPAARENIASMLQRGPAGWEYPGIDGIYEIGADVGEANTVLAGPEALAYAVEAPPYTSAPPGEITVKEITLPRLGIPAWQTTWLDRATRSAWQSVELFFGIAPANAAALSYAADPEE